MPLITVTHQDNWDSRNRNYLTIIAKITYSAPSAHALSPSSPVRVLSSCFPWSMGICHRSSTNRVNRDSRPDVSCCHKDDRKDRRRGGVEGQRERNIPRLTSATVEKPWAIKFRAPNYRRWQALIKWILSFWYFREYTKFVRDWPVGQFYLLKQNTYTHLHCFILVSTQQLFFYFYFYFSIEWRQTLCILLTCNRDSCLIYSMSSMGQYLTTEKEWT